ncbi:MAG: helix-turn-helix domain-containing protein [Actinomycetota bacterium]|nr:helix-turn-helix domain-containing protein [Actinomycetota bacterium]
MSTVTVENTWPEFTLGDRLRKARDWAGIKSAERMAEQLSERFGQPISKGAVTAWERGTNQPTRIRLQDVVEAYADICNVPAAFFYVRTERFARPDLAVLDGELDELSLFDEDLQPLGVPDLALI